MDLSSKILALLNSPKCQGKSQNEIASEIGIASSVITKIKQGKSTDPSAGTIYAISKYFGVSADWLLDLYLVEGNETKVEFSKSTVGERISSALAFSGKRQKDLAAVLGVTDNTVSYYVGGKRVPSTEQLAVIAKYLNVTSDFLIGISNVTATDIEICNNIVRHGKEETADAIESCIDEMKKIADKLRSGL